MKLLGEREKSGAAHGGDLKKIPLPQACLGERIG